MGRKKRPRRSLLKIRKDAADPELIQWINHSRYLLGRQRPRIVFGKGAIFQGLLPECLDAQSLKAGESYLLVESVSNRIFGYVRGETYVSLDQQEIPEPGRLYSLYWMPKA